MTDVIKDEKIRVAIWMLSQGNSKKAVCEYLNIAYNTKKLDILISDFKAKEEKELQLKEIAKKKLFNEIEIKDICQRYLSGESMAEIAKVYFINGTRVKNILITNGIPIRSRKKVGQSITTHVGQNSNTRLKLADKVLITKTSQRGIIAHVYSEEYIDYLLYEGTEKYVELHAKVLPNKAPIEGIHFEVYLEYPDGTKIKRGNVANLIASIEKHIADYGYEYYRVDVEEVGYTGIFKREDLFRIGG